MSYDSGPTMTSPSRQIAAFLADSLRRKVSAAQRHVTYRALLDTYAVALAGFTDDAPRIAAAHLEEVHGVGSASAWGTGERLPAEAAAWLNGIAGHVLDYDDMLPPLVGHPSVAMIPALVALSQQTGADGMRFSAAYIAGYEVLAAISPSMAMKHVMKGWHSTASIGVLGATAACSVLLGLTEEQTANAIGLAVTQAAGNRQNFGTMAKSFQVGQCNAAAVRAALLAQKGFTAPHDAIEGKYGFLALYGENEDLADGFATLGRRPLALDTVGIDVKKYPCCYAIHKALDGVLSLRRAHDLTWDNVERIEIVSQTRGLQPLTYTDPQSGLEGKFSMEYSIAAAMLDGKIQLSSFDDVQVARPEIKARLTRVTKSEAPSPMLPRWATVKIALKNGSAVEQHVTTSRGDAQDPLTDEELIVKAEDCFSYVGRKASAQDIAAKVFGLDKRRVRDVITVGKAT